MVAIARTFLRSANSRALAMLGLEATTSDPIVGGGSRSNPTRATAHINKDGGADAAVRYSRVVDSLPPWLLPESLRGKPAGYVIVAGCLVFLVALGIIDLGAPINVTVSALAVFPVLAAAWFLSTRVAVLVAFIGVLLQAWLALLGSIDVLTMGADVAALGLMVGIGRFAARSWALMQAALDRERALLWEREQAQRRLEAVLEVAQAILGGQPITELMQLIAGRARVLAGAAIAAIAVPDQAGGTYTLEVVDGPAADKLRGQQVRTTHHTSGSILTTREPRIVSDLSEGFSGRFNAGSELGPAMLVPLAVGRGRFGTLVLANLKGLPGFEPEDSTLIQLFAAQAAVAVDYVHVRDELQRLAVLEDRERISQELHDGVIQSLFAVGLELGAMVAKADVEQRDELRGLIAEINHVIRDLRAYIYALAPRGLSDGNLKGALERLASDFTSKLKVSATAHIEADAASLLAAKGQDALQFVSEALSNVVRHSQSDSCSVTLAIDGPGLVLEVRDEGAGFDPHEAIGKGFGLASLEERARRLGGRLELNSARGRGTSVKLHIPTQRLQAKPGT